MERGLAECSTWCWVVNHRFSPGLQLRKSVLDQRLRFSFREGGFSSGIERNKGAERQIVLWKGPGHSSLHSFLFSLFTRFCHLTELSLVSRLLSMVISLLVPSSSSHSHCLFTFSESVLVANVPLIANHRKCAILQGTASSPSSRLARGSSDFPCIVHSRLRPALS